MWLSPFGDFFNAIGANLVEHDPKAKLADPFPGPSLSGYDATPL